MTQPLNVKVDLTGTSTKVPQIAKGTYSAEVKAIKAGCREDDPEKPYIQANILLNEEAPTLEGEIVKPGFVVVDFINLYQESEDWPDFKIHLKRFLKAAYGVEEDDEIVGFDIDEMENLVGRKLLVTMRTYKRKDDGEIRSTVDTYAPAE